MFISFDFKKRLTIVSFFFSMLPAGCTEGAAQPKPTVPVDGTCCMTWDFPLSEAEFNQVAHVSFYTERIEGHNWSERTCNEMRPN